MDGGGTHTYGGPFTIAADGQHVITFWSVDTAGISEVAQTGYVNIDTVAPSTTATGLATTAAGSWTSVTPQTVSLAPATLGPDVLGDLLHARRRRHAELQRAL